MSNSPHLPPIIFSESLQQQRIKNTPPLMVEGHPLVEEIADNLLERLRLVRREFKSILVMGPVHNSFIDALKVTGADVTFNQLSFAASNLPFKEQTFDLVISVLQVHLMNDVPGFLAQINNCLQPDGLFLGAFFGESSMSEFRNILTEIELQHSNGIAQRFHPMISARDGGYLLQRAQFALPVSDLDRRFITYTSLEILKTDLRYYGQNNSLNASATPLSKKIYHDLKHRFPMEITADVIYLSGWRHAPSQPKAAIRGSGHVNLIDVL